MSKKNQNKALSRTDVVIVRDQPAPVVMSQAITEISTRNAEFWPESQALPQSYPKPAIIPCHSCRRLRRDDGRQAVICSQQAHGIAYMKCRVCLHRFKLSIN